VRISQETDASLVTLATAGDAEAFGHLLERYAPAVRRITRAVLENPDDADDAAQEAFLSAWRHLGRYDARRPFGPWLMRIALNAAYDARRRRSVRTTEPLQDQAAGSGATPEVAADRALLRDRVRGALQQLPERRRLALVLYDAEGYSHREIGEMLSIPEGTVRSEVFHARRALRQALKAHGEDIDDAP
jgi:RNA polymerase sigma-70 factor (ECF subfamily)